MVFISLYFWNFNRLVVWKKNYFKKFQIYLENKFDLKEFDDLITYLIISIIIGGRIGYVIFYNFEFIISNPLDIFKIWEGGMSFHGALIGIIVGTYIFSKKKKKLFFFRYNCLCFSNRNFFWSNSKFY